MWREWWTDARLRIKALVNHRRLARPRGRTAVSSGDAGGEESRPRSCGR